MSELTTAAGAKPTTADNESSKYVAPKTVAPAATSAPGTTSDAENFLSDRRLELLLWLNNLELRLPPYGAK